jgi:hypothetical protein
MHLEDIDNAFLLSRESYNKISSEILNLKDFQYSAARYNYFFAPIPLLQNLLLKAVKWDREDLIRAEIMQQYPDLKPYLKEANKILLRQRSFISEFSSSLIMLRDDPRKAWLLKKFFQDHKDDRDHSKDDFLLGLQLYIISIYSMIEELLHSVVPEIKVTNLENVSKITSFNDFLKLDYGQRNPIVIEELYNCLKGQYISSSFDEFQTLFVEGKWAKMQWHSTEPLLVAMVFGSRSLKLINQSKAIAILATRFFNKKGNEFSIKQLHVACQKGETPAYLESRLISFLEKLK